jgi:hypothetical protein
MTFKAEPTEFYAKKFLARFEKNPDQAYLVAVNEEHTPTLNFIEADRANYWLNYEPKRVVGTYRGTDIGLEQLVKDIDFVDDYVPTKLRSAA